jgi:hypothetical protein
VRAPSTEGANKQARSPLAEVLGIGATPGEQQKILREAQEETARCMRKAGFKYIPYSPDQPAVPYPPPGEEDKWQYDHGFGMADGMEATNKLNGVRNENNDPNEEIRANLSKTELGAYDKALYGTPPTSNADGSAARWVSNGCGSAGYSALNEVEERLRPKLMKLYKRIALDSRVVALDRKWSNCMKSAGFSVTSEQQMFDILGLERQKVYDAASSSTPLLDGESPVLPTIPPEMIAEFRKSELNLARADLKCRSSEDRKLRQSISMEYEREFLAENEGVISEVKGK